MAATKTIYKLNWNPSKPMAVATIISLTAVIAAPFFFDYLFSEAQLDFKVIWSCWFIGLAEALLTIGGVLFFYEGVPRRQQFRIFSMLLAFVFIFATISNTIYGNELCELLSRGEMIIHLAAWGTVNIAAMICTLFVYRLEPVKVEVGSPAAVPSTPLWLKLPPAAVPVIFAAIAIALIPLAPNLLPRDKSMFRCTVPFFIGGQLLFGFVTVNWLLTKKTWGQKLRHALMVVATSMFFGTLCNIINVRSTLRPGFRIEISAGEYLLMNLTAMLCVIGYFVWERIRNGEKAKRAELLAATQAGSAATPDVSAPESPGTSAPSAAVSQPAQPPTQNAPPAAPDKTEPALSATTAQKQASPSKASPAVSLSPETEQPETMVAASSSTPAPGSSSSDASSTSSDLSSTSSDAGSAPTDASVGPAATSSTPEEAKSGKGQSSSQNKGPSKKQKSSPHKNGGSQKGGSQKGGAPKNNGASKNNSSSKKSDNNGKPKGGG